jgi:hypothetical protein
MTLRRAAHAAEGHSSPPDGQSVLADRPHHSGPVRPCGRAPPAPDVTADPPSAGAIRAAGPGEGRSVRPPLVPGGRRDNVLPAAWPRGLWERRNLPHHQPCASPGPAGEAGRPYPAVQCLPPSRPRVRLPRLGVPAAVAPAAMSAAGRAAGRASLSRHGACSPWSLRRRGRHAGGLNRRRPPAGRRPGVLGAWPPGRQADIQLVRQKVMAPGGESRAARAADRDPAQPRGPRDGQQGSA